MRLAAVLGLAVCVIAAGCGGSSSAREEPDAQSLEALWRAPGEDVAVVPGNADIGPGAIRYAFLIVDSKNRVVTRPTASIWIARGLKQKPFVRTVARSEAVGVGQAEPGEPEAVYIARLRLEKPGTYWLLAEPVGGRKIQAIGNIVVKQQTHAPDVGAPAIASRTPTLANATLEQLTTARTPDPELYRTSIADALSAKSPFVVVFATPKYCTSRTCGPVVDVVSAVRRRHVGSPIRFLHVEIFEGNDPTKGENQWVREWKLPSEPWVFVVGADGTVRERFEGTVSVRELEDAVKQHLTG